MQYDEENIFKIKSLKFNDAVLPSVIQNAIGNSSPDKISKVIESYGFPDHEIIGAFNDNVPVGMIGICKTNILITIRHISVLNDYQKQGIGTLLLNELKKRYINYRIVSETDDDAVGFYVKSHFTCRKFKSKNRGFRYICEFI